MFQDENPQLEVLMAVLNEKIPTMFNNELKKSASDVGLYGGYEVTSRAASFGSDNEIIFIVSVKHKGGNQHGENTVNQESNSL